ncbi:calmodulin-like [Mercenaria mercenaria]|uniref:calmodulin-like n=1 Tax=Mercenaria mercenaria TaxID=6596 RepID=UPI00234F20F6|nr:calmodulin-like [Mercenaria mercenaria]
MSEVADEQYQGEVNADEQTQSTISDDQVHEIFTSFDTDGSGKLSMTELGNALCLLGIDLTDEELTGTYHIDDDPESLTEEEFALYIRERIGNIDFRKRCEDCLREFDEDGSGLLSRDTLKTILTQRGSYPMSDEDAEALLDECDANADGYFNVTEMADLMYNIPKGHEGEESQAIENV